jgi:hypothetical protein
MVKNGLKHMMMLMDQMKKMYNNNEYIKLKNIIIRYNNNIIY